MEQESGPLRKEEHRQVGVVIERRATGHAWQPWSWYPWAVIPPGPAERWELLRSSEGSTLFHGGLHDVGLFRDQTAYYKQNLHLETPVIYVAFRPAEGAPVESALEPYLLTLSPDEAQAELEGDGTVHPVALPDFLADWAAAFVARHDEERSFVRNKRKEGSAGKHGGASAQQGRKIERRGWEAPRSDG